MGLIKQRPRVKVVAPAPLTPGQMFEATVFVIAEQPVPVDAINIRLHGVEESTVRAGDTTTTRTRTVANLEGRLSGRTVLKAGERAYPFRFRLPKDAPPSFESKGAIVRYTYDVHVAIPWWPDRRASFKAEVGFRDQPMPPGRPVMVVTHPMGPKGKEGYLELSLASDVLAPGDELLGAIALGNSKHVKYRGIEVSLASYVMRVSGEDRESDLRTRTTTVFELPPPGHEWATFDRRLPRNIFPTWASKYWSVDWCVEAKALVTGGPDVVLRAPILIVPSRDHRQGRKAAPPVVGRERVDGIWKKVGDKHGLEWDAGELRGKAGECEIAIARDTNEQGNVLAAELIYPNLRLGLSMRSRLLRSPQISARDPEQTAWFNALLPKAPGLSLQVEDDRMRIEQTGAGQDTARVSGFVRSALAIAKALPRPEDVPPAKQHERWLKAWRELAVVLEGKMNAGDLSARGRLGGCDVELWHHWPKKGKATTLLSARPPGQLKTPSVSLNIHELGELGAALRGPHHRLRTTGDRLVLEVPQQLDPGPLLPLLRTLARLAKVISGGTADARQ